MMPDFYNQAILNLRPNSGWGIRGREIEWSSDEFGNSVATNVIWNDTVNPFPTKEELDAELARLVAEWNATEYQRLRKPEYPPLADLADALYWQAQGDNTKMTAYLIAVAEVKTKYPKE